MKEIHCDGCGQVLSSSDLRYEVAIDVRAVYDQKQVSLLELIQDHRQELLDLIQRMEYQEKTSEEVEESVYKNLKLDLCPACQKSYIQSPVNIHNQSDHAPDPDLESFLRSLDKGRSAEAE